MSLYCCSCCCGCHVIVFKDSVVFFLVVNVFFVILSMLCCFMVFLLYSLLLLLFQLFCVINAVFSRWLFFNIFCLWCISPRSGGGCSGVVCFPDGSTLSWSFGPSAARQVAVEWIPAWLLSPPVHCPKGYSVQGARR